MRNALRSMVILGILSVLEVVVFVPLNATAQAAKPTNKIACCIPGNPPTCGQLTADNCTKHNGTSLGAVSCAHNPCSGATTTTTTVAATTTTSSAAPTRTTSSTTSSTSSITTSTTCPALSLKYTTAPGTSSCGGSGLATPPTAPFSDQIDSDTACTAKISDLGSSCLYIGGGANGAVPGGPTPAGAASYLDVVCPQTGALAASNGNGKFCHGGTNHGMSCTTNAGCPLGSCGGIDCTKASGPAKECVNAGTCVGGPTPGATCFAAGTFCGTGGSCTGVNPHVSCTADTDCGGIGDSCQLVANCFFGPPLAIPNPAIATLPSCNINVIETEAD